jgi:peptidyl-prolyl cis-trans isomerase D
MFTLQGLRSPQRLAWLWKTVIFGGFGLLIISFVFFYGWNHSSGGSQNVEFARVHSGSPLPWKRWIKISADQMSHARNSAVQSKVSLLPQMYQQVLQQYQMDLSGIVSNEDIAREAANRILLARAAEDRSVHVPRQEIISMIEAQGGTNEALASAARASGLRSAAQLIELERSNADQGRLRALVGNVAHASLFELWQEYQISQETMDLQIAGYPASNFTAQVPVTEADLQAYLDEHKSSFEIPAQRRYAYVAYTLEQASAGIAPTEDELKAYYETHQKDYMEKAAREVVSLMVPLYNDASSTGVSQALASVRERAKAESSWTSLSREIEAANPGISPYPSGPEWVELEGSPRPAEYLNALKALAVGDVSEPFVAQQGVYMIKVLSERGNQARPFDLVRTQVEAAYKQAKASETFDSMFQKFQAEAANHHENIRSFSQAIGIQDQLTTMVAALDPTIPGVATFSEDANYITDQLEVNHLSDPLRNQQAIAVLQVVEQSPAHVPALAEARNTVESAYRLEKARDIARQAAEAAQQLIASGADFKSALADAPKAPFDVPGVTRLQPISSLGGPLIGFRNQTLRARQGSYGLSVYGRSETEPEGYAVWSITALKPADQAKFTEERDRFERDYLDLQRRTIDQEWLRDLRAKADFQLTQQP